MKVEDVEDRPDKSTPVKERGESFYNSLIPPLVEELKAGALLPCKGHTHRREVWKEATPDCTQTMPNCGQ